MPNASPRYSPVGSKPAVKSNEDSHSTRNTPPAAAFFAVVAPALSGRALAVVTATVNAAVTATARTMAAIRRFLTGRSSLVGAGGGPTTSCIQRLDVQTGALDSSSFIAPNGDRVRRADRRR